MTYCTVYTGNVVVGGKTYRQVAGVFPAIAGMEAGDIAAFLAANPGTEKYVDGSNALINVTGWVHPGWYIDTATNVAQRAITALISVAEQRKGIGKIKGRRMWRSIPFLDLTKPGEGDLRSQAVTLTGIKTVLAASVDAALANDAQWAVIESLLDMDMGRFHVVHSDHATTGLTTARLYDRYLYTYAGWETAANNSVAPALATSTGQILPANWINEEGTLGDGIITSVNNYLFG